jgi:hypothetical protein
MKKILLRIVDAKDTKKESGFLGYYVVVSFIMRTSSGMMNSALKVELNDKGEGVLYLPPSEEIENDFVHFEFYGPAGYWIAERKTLNESALSASDKKPFVLTIDMLQTQSIEKNSYLVNGRLVDVKTAQKISKKQFYVIESLEEDVSNNNYKILQVLVTDLEGYFKFEMEYDVQKAEINKYYYAVIPDSQEKIIPLRQEGNQLEQKQILAVTPIQVLQEEGANDEKTDCACDDTPRLPSTTDYGSLEGAFSQDLGIGCVEFTKANRVIEEYQFSYVVRTTDPEIKKLTLNTNTFKEILDGLQGQTKFVVYPMLTLPANFVLGEIIEEV